jgi:hypothetical protein
MLSRTCPENNKRRNNTKSNFLQKRGVGTKAPGSIGVNKQHSQAGVFVEANILDLYIVNFAILYVKSKLLVDTGAIVTALFKAVFDRTQQHNRGD